MKGFLLLIIAVIMSAIFWPIGWVYSLVTFRLSFKRLGGYYKTIAISIDQLGNVIMATIFNDLLIRKAGHKFGDEDETVSMVLGINKKDCTLTDLGYAIAKILNKIDPNHVEKAIE